MLDLDISPLLKGSVRHTPDEGIKKEKKDIRDFLNNYFLFQDAF